MEKKDNGKESCPVEVHREADIHLQFYAAPQTRADGCPKQAVIHGKIMLEQVSGRTLSF